MEQFSTLSSVQARANELRIDLWTDKDEDGTPDPATLSQGFDFAASTIFEYVQKRYGETEIDSWTLADCPPKVKSLSDDLSIWHFSGGNYSQNPQIQYLYDRVLETLEAIRDYVSDLYGALEGVETRFVTEELENPFEERQYFNTSVDYGEPENGGYCA